MGVISHRREYAEALARDLEQRMIAVEGYIRDQYQTNVGVPYPPASRPGEYPHRRSGALQRGVRTNVNRVGSLGSGKIKLSIGNVARSPRGFDYPLALETGTVKMRPRPHATATLNSLTDVIRRAMNAR